MRASCPSSHSRAFAISAHRSRHPHSSAVAFQSRSFGPNPSPSTRRIATLSQLGDLVAARALPAQWLATLPEELRHIQAQRQAFYVLPDPAWQRFKQGLSQAGMPP